LIQGPPGTGKTKTLAMIVALMHIYSKDPIMICSDQNETADLLYEALNKHESIASTVIRVYSKSIVDKKIKRK
jgi:MoxR-like ATPase